MSTEYPPRVEPGDSVAARIRIQDVIRQGPFEATWESLSHYQPPLWYEDAKFGVFLHWGIFSVPAFRNEWYARDMYRQGTPEFRHHVDTYGHHTQFGYKDFIPMFTMERFDPDSWATLFRRAGFQYVVPVAEHHDGFAMYDTKRSRWSAPVMGPRRDVFGDLLTASTRAGMVTGASSHRAEHWFFMNGGTRFDSNVLEPEYMDFYGPAQLEETAPNEAYLEDWLLRTIEIIDRYQPQVLWFDWWIEHPAFKPYLLTLAAYYYNTAATWNRGVVLNFKWDALAVGSAVYDIERGTMGGIRSTVWQNDTSVSKTAWGFVDGHDYKTVSNLLAELADTVSKNGVLLLNIGPKADGTIPDREQELLLGIGKWLNVNGEAIYGTRPWVTPCEGPTIQSVGSFVDEDSPSFTAEDIRFTTRSHVTGDYVYGILLGHPHDGTAIIRAFGSGAGLLATGIEEVTILGQKDKISWTQKPHQLVVHDVLHLNSDLGPVVKIRLANKTDQPRTDFLHD